MDSNQLGLNIPETAKQRRQREAALRRSAREADKAAERAAQARRDAPWKAAQKDVIAAFAAHWAKVYPRTRFIPDGQSVRQLGYLLDPRRDPRLADLSPGDGPTASDVIRVIPAAFADPFWGPRMNLGVFVRNYQTFALAEATGGPPSAHQPVAKKSDYPEWLADRPIRFDGIEGIYYRVDADGKPVDWQYDLLRQKNGLTDQAARMIAGPPTGVDAWGGKTWTEMHATKKP